MNIALDSKVISREIYLSERRSEKIDGKIIQMASPNTDHNGVLHAILGEFFKFFDNRDCRVFSETDVHLSEKNSFRPDICVVCDKSIIKNKKIMGAPDLVVEILSASTAKYDRGRKMEIYGESGVREYWIVDINNMLVEIYLPRENIFFFHYGYVILSPYTLEDMTEEEIARYPLKFNSVIFDDMQLDLRDIFKYIL